MTVNFLVAADGTLSQQGKAKIKPSATPVTNGFIAGRYYVKYGSAATQFGTVTSGVSTGGSTVWSLVMDASPDGYFPDEATWQTGNPSPDVAARLMGAGVQLDPDYSYGLTEVGDHNYNGNPFAQDNGLLAAYQINNTLTVVSYTDGNFHDHSTEQGSITYILCVDASCSNAPK